MEFKFNSCDYDIKEFVKKIIKDDFNINDWDEWLEEQDYNSLQEYPNYLVSAENNDLIGTCSIKKIDDYNCNLNTFYVKKEYRNKGIGTKLFNMCIDYVLNNNYKRIIIHVDPRFTGAKRFYENNGFILDYYDKEMNELNYHKDI